MPLSIDRRTILQLREAARDLGQAERKIDSALSRSVNLGARRGRTISSRAIRDEIAFKAPYVNQRLTVTRRASPSRPTAVITGRDRETQIIRFATPASVKKLRDRKGKTRAQIARSRASVRVKKGGALQKVKYFWVPLKNDNEGLAFRSGGKFSTGKDKFDVVYSVSVDQAFGDVRDRVTTPILNIVENEFERQLGVIFNAR